MRKVTKNLPVKLTRSELVERREELAKLVQEALDLTEKKRQATAAMNADLKKVTLRVAEISKAISTGLEERDVACEEHELFEINTIRTIRTDTGEVVGDRAISAKERQTSIATDVDGGESAELDEDGGIH